MDDILVGGESEEDHARVLHDVIERATQWNLGLNFEKCQTRKRRVQYVGHTVTEHGLELNTEKVRAVLDMPTPDSKGDVRWFLGMIQYLGKFIPEMSTIDAPLRELLKKETKFHWSKTQQESFRKLKEACSGIPVLALYNKDKEVTIQCDANSCAIGGVLLQEGRPVAYTSRALTPTEKNYVQIEKETLAIVHCCKRFH